MWRSIPANDPTSSLYDCCQFYVIPSSSKMHVTYFFGSDNLQECVYEETWMPTAASHDCLSTSGNYPAKAEVWDHQP
jgi:hypothetical protein